MANIYIDKPTPYPEGDDSAKLQELRDYVAQMVDRINLALEEQSKVNTSLTTSISESSGLEETFGTPDNFQSGFSLAGGGYYEFGNYVIVNMAIAYTSSALPSGLITICDMPAAITQSFLCNNRQLHEACVTLIHDDGKLKFNSGTSHSAGTLYVTGIYRKTLEAN